MKQQSKTILITGGAGFIGSHVVRLFVEKYSEYLVVNLDKLTYAGNLENLNDVENQPNYVFEKGDITDEKFIFDVFEKYQFDGVIHLAAESHVDRSISDPIRFLKTNILGTVVLMNAAKNLWRDDFEYKRFYHVSTDEVYGSVNAGDFFLETTPYDPRSPYSASKAGSDHFVRAYGNTYHLPIVISNCCNNYGPNQFPEKLIPLFINNIKNNKPLPVYGKGENVRDWMYVLDHAQAIDLVYHRGKNGQTYNVGGFNETRNIDLIKVICRMMDDELGRQEGTSEQLITYVDDRSGHDMRYAIDATKIMKALGWKPGLELEEGIRKTITWYLENEKWLSHVTSGSYQNYYYQQHKTIPS